MNICFYGVGGVGGYYGALVTKYFNATGKGNTYFIARGKHKDAILEKGLLLKQAAENAQTLIKPFRCSDTVNGLPVFDIIVVSVKGYDLAKAIEEICKVTNENTIIVPLLNGVDIYDRIRRKLSKGYILPACLYLSSYIESPGVIFQKGGSRKISVGKDPLFSDFYPEKLIQIFKNAEILIEFYTNVDIEIWKKYVFIASFSLVTACYDKSIGEVVNHPRLRNLVKSIMQEISMIAEKLKIELPSDIVETSFSTASQFPFEAKTSFQKDFERKGKESEWDLFGTTIIKYAEKLNINADNTKITFDKLMQLI
jgi:2-dehydropantoate 2-reductase